MFADLPFFKKSVASLAQHVTELRTQIEEAQRQREDIASAPATREDIKAMVEAWASAKSDHYLKRLHFNIQELVTNPAKNLSDANVIERRMSLFGKSRQLGEFAMFPGPELQDEAICCLLGPALVKSLHAAIDAMPWPAGALPLAGREKRLTELDKKIGKLTAEEGELVAAARDALVL